MVRTDDREGTGELRVMAEFAEAWTADDHDDRRRRRLALVRPLLDFEEARLRRLIERARDTRDP
ncbi:MAG: hypothetical protein AB7T37_00585 [Dehalococcoidia bacterium]